MRPHPGLDWPKVIIVGISVTLSLETAVTETSPFSIVDYFSVQRVTELALSSDGATTAYVVERQSLEENRSIRSVYVSETAPDAKPAVIDKIRNARSLAWVPGGKRLAFLMEEKGADQVFEFHARTEEIVQTTSSQDQVTAFRFDPDGERLAFTTQAGGKKSPSLNERLFKGETGVVIDSEITSVYHFVDPSKRDWVVRSSNRLWIRRPDGQTIEIEIPGRVQNFHWSPNGSKLSVLYVSEDLLEDPLARNYVSIGIYDVRSETFSVFGEAHAGQEANEAVYFAGGEWVPGSVLMHVRRLTQENAWHSRAEWSLVDTTDDAALSGASWRAIEHSGEDTLVPAGTSRLYLCKTVRAVYALYELTPDGLSRAELIRDLSGAVKFFQFSADFKSAAFVHENITTPPEIYIWTNRDGRRRLTNLNGDLAARITVHWREVQWEGKDGAVVSGWLIEPDAGARPRGLLTFVHGGPGVPMRNEFAYYFLGYGGLWPYPFLHYAANGISVFLPNYRGTSSFGDDHQTPDSLDGAPLLDIVAGVDYLIAEGISDPDHLAIAGQSHGAWLAPLVMVRDRRYTAGSFAEGAQNTIVNYSLMPMYLNRVTHDVQYGASLYDNQEFYIDNSADLYFEGLHTAVLFEAGATASAVAMLGSPKAALRAGMPAEFVVYPHTGHGIRTPRLQRESAERNTDWLRFWLQGFGDSNPEKAEQYERWRKMRGDQCTRLGGEDDAPWYCRQQ